METSILGRYEILEELGQGGMGQVVKARDSTLLRLVAIKIVPLSNDFEFIARLKREAQTIAVLSHPNIVTLYDVGQVENSAFIVMEYVSGETLQSRLQKVPPAEWPALMPALLQCAGGLDYAHRRGIVHRDIKPSNIMIGNDGVAKILDFGIAKVASGGSAEITQTGTVLGTLSHMSPEQVEGKAVGPASDQYALALIAYTLLAGRHPFPVSETPRLLYQIVFEMPPPPSSVNPLLGKHIDAVLLRALSKDPGQRFSSCTEMLQALDERAAGAAAPVTSAVPQRPPAISAPGPSSGPKRTTALWGWLKDRLGGEQPAPATEPPSALPVPPPPPAPPPPALPPPQTQRFTPPTATPPAPWPTRPPKSLPSEYSKVFGSPQQMPPATSPPPQLPANPPVAGEFTQMYQSPQQTARLRRSPEERVDAEALARAQARELVEIIERRDFESGVALRGKWLPGIEGATGELLGFSEAARYLGAAQDAVSPHVRIDHLRRAEKVLFTVGNQLLAGSTPAARHLPDALEVWKTFSRELLSAAEQRASAELPNPFRAGQPLRPDQGLQVFRGRTGLVRRIEAILADVDQSSSLALLGPRRCGKTSLLQMLPAMLPDCACVFFDLQDNPVSTVPEFFEALIRRAREQVRAHRRVELPELIGGGTFEAATRWFDQLDNMAEANRFLISIDEFERLEDLFPGDRKDLLRLMGLFRATIQHRRKVRLLVSGVAPFEELGSLWNDHFINVRELRIGHLDEDTSIDLLSRPIPEFPEGAVSVEVAREIYVRTGGQPYLVQLYGTLLINLLNEEGRTASLPEDVARVEEDALSQGRYYFGNTYQDAPDDARRAMESLARGDVTEMSGATRRWLERRWLIDEEGNLRTPVLGAFILEELR